MNTVQRPPAGSSGASAKDRRDNLPFMSKVDAALHRTRDPGSHWLLAAVCGTFSLLLLWAAFADIDEVVRGMGQVIPSMRSQIIENREGGILHDVLVSEGEIVEKDDLLLRIVNESTGSQRRGVETRLLELEAAIARLEAEASGADPVFSARLKEKAPEIVTDQLAQYNSRRQRFASEKSGLESQLEQQRQNVKELEARRHTAQALLANTEQHYKMAREGVRNGSVSRADFLRIEKEVLSLRGELEGIMESLPKSQAVVREAEQRLSTHQAAFAADALAEQNKARMEINQQQEQFAALRDQADRQEVRSPVRGIVNQVHMHTRGGVVKPATPLMEIVPLDDTLLIEARISPTDIAFLHPGQQGIVKITAYDFSIFGGLEAQVVHISPNSLKDERGDIFYRVRLRTKRNALLYKDKELSISPGMVASVDILTGKKTVLDYLLKPILKARQEALRER